MNVNIKNYLSPSIDKREILRYAGCRAGDARIEALMAECLSEVCDHLTYKVCWRELSLHIQEEICDFKELSFHSANLASHLQGCERGIILGATVGASIDRMISKYSRLSPVKALLLQAIGTERVEALCDRFVSEWEIEHHASLTSRFSPGYGDLPLECQREIFGVLEAERSIGLYLNDSLLMSPSKSVTAIIGIKQR